MSSATPNWRGKTIGVLAGGRSPERAGSLASGSAVFDALCAAGHPVIMFDTAATAVHDLQGRIDVAVLATHGPHGEDGKLQGALDAYRLPYAGSGVLASAIGMHKPTFKQLLTVVAWILHSG